MNAERIYRMLIRLLPQDLRDSFGDDMARDFLDRLRDTPGVFPKALVWARAVSDLVSATLLERRQAGSQPDSSYRPRWLSVNSFVNDVRYAIRGLVKNPTFTIASVTTLSLGIGATAVAFTLVNGVLIRPLPFDDPERLVMLWERRADGQELTLSFPNFDDWREQSQTLQGIAAIRFPFEVTVLGGDEPTRGTPLQVSREFFDVLGVQPFLGRPILPDENRDGGELVAVLDFGFWVRSFGANPDLGSLSLTISGRPFSIVGVMPRGFKVLEEGDVYLPLELNPFRVRDSHNYRAIGRLAPGITWAQAQDEMNRIATAIQETHPDETRTVGVNMRPLITEILGEVDRPLLLLMLASAMLLLLACSNVASTLLARGTVREREMAIRTAVGASRSRLIRQLFTESVVVAGLAGILGLGLSYGALAIVRAQGPDMIPRLQTVSIDPWVLLFVVGTTLVTSLVFGLLPALGISRDSAGTLRAGQRGDTGKTRALGWNLLVGGEAALAVVLVVASGLLVRSLQEILSAETNFQTDGILTVALDFTSGAYQTEEVRANALAELKREFSALPGVTAVGFVNHLPTQSTSMTGPVFASPVPDRNDIRPEDIPPSSGWRVVDEDYFATMGIPLLRGRGFSRTDGPDAPPVIVLNETVADLVFPGEDPIGRLVQFVPFWQADLTVVGVVAESRDWRRDRGNQPEAYVFWPQRAGYTRYLTAVISTERDPIAIARPLRERLRAVAPNVPGTIRTMNSLVGESLQEQRFTLTVLGSFASLSLLLAAVGIFGVVSYTVSRRSREIGIRLALGASSGTVRRRIFAASFCVVLLGNVVGVGLALLGGGLIESLLYEVSPLDPAILVLAPMTLLGAAAVAIWVPVTRYTRVDPLVTMRAE